ncbi:MAG: OmpA family protein [Chlamydiota bacterium]|nr:OmpA family protein [Chlamydiota bacterium]
MKQKKLFFLLAISLVGCGGAQYLPLLFINGCCSRPHPLWEGMEYQGKKCFLERERGVSKVGVSLEEASVSPLPLVVESRETLLVGSLYFEKNADVIKDKESYEAIDLKGVAHKLKRDPSLRLRVEGHCDERASEAYNFALGLRRARGIETLMKTLGAPPSSLEIVSFGKEKPAVLGSRPSDWEKNRRVELKLITPKKRG